jgi:preprotein translocase subunit SecE
MPDKKDNITRLEQPQPASKTPAKKVRRRVKGSNRIARWFREMRSELKKVVWPTPKQIVNNTFVAVTVMAASAVVIWAIDFASSEIFSAIRQYVPIWLGR